MPNGESLQLISVMISALCLAVLGFSMLRARYHPPKIELPLYESTQPVFLFEGTMLVDATGTAKELVARRPRDMSEFDGMLNVLRDQFPTIEDSIENLPDFSKKTIHSDSNETLFLDVERFENTLRIALNGFHQFKATQDYKGLERKAHQRETSTLRFAFEKSPQLIWQEDDEGQVIWANAAYLKYSDFIKPKAKLTSKTWPSHRLFDDISFPLPEETGSLTKRRSIQLDGQDAEHWFDVTSMPGPGGAFHFASDANDVMRAEESQKAFMSTITNTFAQLSIGLAIFDRNRRLASYNPAFADVTKLPASFLIGRPSIEIVLDRLRDLQRLPEPKDYGTFRDQFAALEAEAHNGTYLENWDMPDGQTYRVTGRPHFGGALAFLFEDITAEVSLTRRFRSEIETGQAVIDNIPDAIAVFSPSNTLVMSNLAYSDLWPNETEMLDLRTSLRAWKSQCASSGVWRSVETFANSHREREAWTDLVFLKDGRQFELHVIPLPGSMSMIKFSKSEAKSPTLRKLTAPDQALLYSKP